MTANALVQTAQMSRLDLPSDCSFEDWLEVGQRLKSMHESVAWWVGDWLLFGETAFAGRIAKAVELTGYAPDRLKEFRRVAAVFPVGERIEAVGWSQHAIASKLPAPDRTPMLELAQANRWSIREMKFEVTKRAAQIDGEGHSELGLPDVVKGTLKRTGKLVHAAFQDWYGVGEEYARALLCLYQASGEKRDWREIARFVSTHQPMTRGAVQEAIHVLRGEMESESIDRDEDGYWLTEVGFADVRRAFREIGGQLIGLGAEAANDGGVA